MKQLTVLVPNERGIAAKLAKCLAERGVNIEEIDIEGVEDHGMVVLSVDRYDEALRALSDQGFRVITQDTLLVRLEDKPGALAAMAAAAVRVGPEVGAAGAGAAAGAGMDAATVAGSGAAAWE